MLVFVWITFAGFLRSGSGLSHHTRHERTRYVSSRNQIYGGSHSPNFDYNQNYIPFVHYWERPLQVLESSMNVPKKLSSRPLFSWDIPVPISTYTPSKKASTVDDSTRSVTVSTTASRPLDDVPFAAKSVQKSRSDRAKASLAYHESYDPVKKKKSSNRKKSIQESKVKEFRGQNPTTNKRESKEKLKRKKKGRKNRKGKTDRQGGRRNVERNEMNDQVNEVNPKMAEYLGRSGKIREKIASPPEESKKKMEVRLGCEAMEDRCEHRCREDKGEASCVCFRGFIPVGTRCVDINECETNNGGCNGKCVNTLGSRKCICSAGFRSVDGTCADVNECLLRNGHGPCQDRCTNTVGSYYCTCDGLPGTTLSSDRHTCEDTTQCNLTSAGCSHSCISISGTAFCTCPDGLELGDDWKTCHDIDECSNPEDYNVRCELGCINTMGSYACAPESSTTAGENST